MTLFYCITDQVWVSSVSVNFCRSYAPLPLLELKILEIHSFLHFPPTCFDLLTWNFACHFILINIRSSSSVVNFVDFCRSYATFITENTRNTQYSALFSFMLWHIELKFYVWLYFTILQIKLECGQFPSIFVGVMPFLGLRILEIHSFLHFSPTCSSYMHWQI